MAGRVDTGATYRAGRGGVRITWRDGSTTSHSAGVRFAFTQSPLKIEGRLYRVGSRGLVGYEAPTLEPTELKGCPGGHLEIWLG